MPVTVYKSTDASAPPLDGLAGSLTTLLDAVLVNGYGAKASAGWAIAYTGTNKRIYRPPSGALRGHLRVQDDAPRAAPFNDGREARLKCSEGASAIDTQTGPYPATTNGGIIRKSAIDDATARSWVAIADARTLYFFCHSGDYGLGWASFMAGEYFSLQPLTDDFNGMFVGSVTEQIAATPTVLAGNENLPKLSDINAVTLGHFTPRGWRAVAAAAVNVGKHGNAAHSTAGLVGLTPYPNPVDQGLYLSQVWLHEPMTLGVIRGRLRGYWHLLHPASALADGDTWAGSGPLVGKTFLALKPVPNGLGTFVIETSNTWETN